MPLINPTYAKHLGKYEKLVVNSSEILKDIYWTKNKLFSGAKAFYSDTISDYYWTLVQHIEPSSLRELRGLEKEVIRFFSNLKKSFSFYLNEYDRKRKIHLHLARLGYKKVFEDHYMFLEDRGSLVKSTLPMSVSIKEVKSQKENETYIGCYTRAYTSNPEDVYYDFGEEGAYEGIYRKTWRNNNLRKKYRKFVGYLNNQPACCGAIYYKGSLGFLSEVGTENRFRRKGLAKAVSLKCIKAGYEEGCDTIMLMTENNSAAYGLYKSLGFIEKTVFWGMSKTRTLKSKVRK